MMTSRIRQRNGLRANPERSGSAEFNVHGVEELMRLDPSLTYKLLRYLNSPLLGRSGEVRDIRERYDCWREGIQAMDSIVAWCSGIRKPIELARTAVMRDILRTGGRGERASGRSV